MGMSQNLPIFSYNSQLKFGYNPDIGTTAESVWDAGGAYPWPAAAAATTIVSTDAKDTSDGVGARTVQVYGLDSDYKQINETVILAGQTPVALTNQYLRVYRAKVLTVGSELDNAGSVQVKHSTTVIAQISAGYIQTLMAVYTIPAGLSAAYLVNWRANVGKLKDAELTLWIREYGSVFQVKDLARVYQAMFSRDYRIAMKIPERADMELRAVSENASTPVAAGFDLFHL